MHDEPPALRAVPRRDTGPLDGRGRHLHVLNVGGAGMSAVATILAQMGHHVTGTDAVATPFLPRLRELGADIVVGDAHPAAAEADLMVTSTATRPDHADLRANADAAVVHRRDVLATIGEQRPFIAVAGTHGKSTTTGMLATIARAADPETGFLAGTAITGMAVGGIDVNADWGSASGAFVIEADESDGTFIRLGATHAVVTNVEADHLGFWGNEDDLHAGFAHFVAAVPGHTVLCLDDPGTAALVPIAGRPVTYGHHAEADHHIDDVGPHGLGVRYRHTVRATGATAEVVVPAAPGAHNAANAAAAIAVAVEVLGLDLAVAADALAAFAGVSRRFQARGTAGGVTFVDSYDHHPTEIAAVLRAAADANFDRVVCVFQPHRFTRTRDLAPAFADAFVDADVVAITEVYRAGEDPIPGVSGRLVLDAVVAAHPDAEVVFTGDLDATTEWMVDTVRPGDLCLTLNAGDLTLVPDAVRDRLEAGNAR